MSLPEDAPQTATGGGRWLTIVGIGEEGPAGLTPVARFLIERAEVVYGGRRHLALVAPFVKGEARPWPSPFEAGVEAVVAERGLRETCVVASGDPFHFGVGATLARRVSPHEMLVVPAPSAFSLAAARLGWPLQEAALVSLHGRPIELVLPHLQPGARIIALTSDGAAPAAIAALIARSGFPQSRLTVLEAMGGGRERLSMAPAGDFAIGDIGDLNVLAIEVAAGPGARVLSRAAGLDDALYEHDGQLTKREIRALTLSALAPRRGELLWDIGAGSGSVAIEWMLADPSLAAVAVEARAERAERIARNALAFGVPALEIRHGRAPEALVDLPAPDAVFIGGGASRPGLLDAAMTALKAGGRLVVNAVTLETEILILALQAAHGGELTRIAIERAAPVGGMTGWRPALPVTQWSYVKP